MIPPGSNLELPLKINDRNDGAGGPEWWWWWWWLVVGCSLQRSNE